MIQPQILPSSLGSQKKCSQVSKTSLASDALELVDRTQFNHLIAADHLDSQLKANIRLQLQVSLGSLGNVLCMFEQPDHRIVSCIPNISKSLAPKPFCILAQQKNIVAIFVWQSAHICTAKNQPRTPPNFDHFRPRFKNPKGGKAASNLSPLINATRPATIGPRDRLSPRDPYDMLGTCSKPLKKY